MVLAIVMLLSVWSIEAQQFSLTDGMTAATTQTLVLVGYVRNFVYAISAIVAIYGAFIVFQKFQNGERDTNKAIATWGGAFIFFFAAGFVIDSAFGL